MRGDLLPGCDVSTYLRGILGALLYVLRWRSEKASQWDSTPFFGRPVPRMPVPVKRCYAKRIAGMKRPSRPWTHTATRLVLVLGIARTTNSRTAVSGRLAVARHQADNGQYISCQAHYQVLIGSSYIEQQDIEHPTRQGLHTIRRL